MRSVSGVHGSSNSSSSGMWCSRTHTTQQQGIKHQCSDYVEPQHMTRAWGQRVTHQCANRFRSLKQQWPVQAAADTEVQPAAAPKQPPAIQLSRPKRPLNWQQWERRLFERLLKADEEQAVLASPDSAEWYYSYWDCPDAHLPALQDTAYQAAWGRALQAAAPLLQDAVVLDVGCGLGTLAIAAAQAGARHVYAVDASPGAADLARKVVAAHGLSSKVTVINGRAELAQLPVRHVDVVLCDWMGSMLLHDSLLPALLRVRDKWLAPGGVMLPDVAQLFVSGVDDRQYLGEQAKLWGNRRMGPGDGMLLKPVLNAVIKHPRVDSITRNQLVTDTQQLLSLDLYKVQLQDLSFQRKVQLTAARSERISGLCAHFDVAWTCRGKLEGGAAAGPIFSTGPLAASTSWLQTVFSFPKVLHLEAGQQLAVDFKVDSVGLPPGRMLDVSVEVEFQGMRATVPYQLKR